MGDVLVVHSLADNTQVVKKNLIIFMLLMHYNIWIIMHLSKLVG